MTARARSARAARPRVRRVDRLIRRLSFLYFFAVVLIYLTETLVAEHHWAAVLLTYGPQRFYLLPAPVLLLAALVRRRWHALVASMAAAGLCVFGLMGMALPHWPAAAPSGATVRVMTLNAGYLHDTSAPALAQLIKEEKADVVCLQEASPMRYGRLGSDTLQGLPGWSLLAQGELVVLSRSPIRAWRVHRYSESVRTALAAEVSVEGKRLTVVTTHLNTAYPPAKLKRNWRGLAEYLRTASATRDREVEEVLEFVRQQPGPVLLAGDFNTPPRGMLYRRITMQLRDAFAAAGTGTGYTFPDVGPHYRIDYLFAGPGLEPRACAPLAVRVSDHLPVVGEFVVRDQGAGGRSQGTASSRN